jgi:hypothetical protein
MKTARILQRSRRLPMGNEKWFQFRKRLREDILFKSPSQRSSVEPVDLENQNAATLRARPDSIWLERST